MLRNLKIQTKLFIGFGGMFLVTLIIIILVNYFLFVDTITKISNGNSEYISDTIYKLTNTISETSLNTHLKTVVEKNMDIMRFYHEQYQKKLLSEKKAKERIEEIILSQKVGTSGYGWVYNFDESPEKILIDIHPKVKGADIAKYDFAQQAFKIKNGLIEYEWQNPDEDEAKKKIMAVGYFKPWNWQIGFGSYKSEFTDLVGFEYLRAKILSIKIDKGDRPYIIGPKGDVIIHSYMEGQNVFNMSDERGKFFFREIIKKKNGKVNYLWKDEDGSVREIIAFYHYLKKFDWYVVVPLYKDELNKPIIVQRNLMITISTISIVLLVLITFLISRVITKPIKELGKLAGEMSDGNLDVKINVNSKDEIGYLAKSFNEMSSQLKESFDKIKEYNEDLEEMVKERTKDLQEALQKVQRLKTKQDGDYFLTSLLTEPLGKNLSKSNKVKIDCFLRQMKQFSFKNKTYEIGGDISISNAKKITSVY